MKRLLAKAGASRGTDTLTSYHAPTLEQVPHPSQSPSQAYVPFESTHAASRGSQGVSPYPSYSEEHLDHTQQRALHNGHKTDAWDSTSGSPIDDSGPHRQRSTWAKLKRRNLLSAESHQAAELPLSSVQIDRDQHVDSNYISKRGITGYQTYGQESYGSNSQHSVRSTELRTVRQSSQIDQSSWQVSDNTSTSSPTNKRTIWSGLSGKASKVPKDNRTDAPPEASFDVLPPPTSREALSPCDTKTRPEKLVTWSSRIDKRKSKGLSVPSMSKRSAADKSAGITEANNSNLTAKIRWICSHPAMRDEVDAILSLAELVAQSEVASKEAARAVRKELKWGSPESQQRAIRVWAMLMLYGADPFRLQVAQRRFLEILELVMTDPKTSLTVKENLLDLWGMFAYHFQKDSDLAVIAKAFNRIRPADCPKNGHPLNLAHDAFSTEIVGLSTSRLLDSTSIGSHSSKRSAYDRRTPDSESCSAPNHGRPFGPTLRELDSTPVTFLRPSTPISQLEEGQELADKRSIDEQLRDLHAECDLGRTNAELLIDAITHAGLQSSEIAEFAERVQQSRESLVNQVPWASSAASHSRTLARESWQAAQQHAPASSGPDVGDMSAETSAETAQEKLLADILDTLEQLVAAQAILESAREEEAAAEEERMVTELSKVDFRLDRSKMNVHAETGDLYDISRLMPGAGLDKASANMCRDPSAASASSMGASAGSAIHAKYRPLPVPNVTQVQDANRSSVEGPFNDCDNLLKTSSPAVSQPFTVINTNRFPPMGRQDDLDDHSDASSIIVTPTRPSAKALGKRRAISRDDFDDAVVAATTRRLEGTSVSSPEEAKKSSAGATVGDGATHDADNALSGGFRGTTGPAPMTKPGEELATAAKTTTSSSSSSSSSSSFALKIPDTAVPPALPPVPVELRQQALQAQQRQQTQQLSGHKASPV